MLIYIITTILLIPLMSLTNRTRGGGGLSTVKFLPFAGRACRVRALMLFGVVVSSYAALNNILSPHAAKFLLLGNFDLGLLIASGLGFLIWATLGWGEYMDMGTWQREHAPEPEVTFIDSFLNVLAGIFPKEFDRRDVWIPTDWNTKEAYSDLVGMILRTGIMSIPLFAFYSWYFSNPWIILLSLYLGCTGFVYFVWSKMLPDKDFLAQSEWTTGALIWGGSMIAMFSVV